MKLVRAWPVGDGCWQVVCLEPNRPPPGTAGIAGVYFGLATIGSWPWVVYMRFARTTPMVKRIKKVSPKDRKILLRSKHTSEDQKNIPRGVREIFYNTTHWVRIVLDVYLLGFPSFAQQSSIFHCRCWICVENFRWFCAIKLPKARNLLIDQSSLEPSYRLEGCGEKSRKAWRWKTRALHELLEKQCQIITSWVQASWMWWFLWPSRSSSVSGLS